MRQPRIVGPASEIEEHSRFCTCCERPLKSKVAWLEKEISTGRYHDRGGIPAENSQGWFPFGLTCARRLLSTDPQR